MPPLAPPLNEALTMLLEGCRGDALLDTGLPASIISLEFLHEARAKRRKPEELPQQW